MLFKAEYNWNTPQCTFNAFPLNLRKKKKQKKVVCVCGGGGDPLTCAQSRRREVSRQLEHPRELASSFLPDSRKVSLAVTVLQSVRVLSLLSYFSIHQVSRAFSLPSSPPSSARCWCKVLSCEWLLLWPEKSGWMEGWVGLLLCRGRAAPAGEGTSAGVALSSRGATHCFRTPSKQSSKLLLHENRRKRNLTKTEVEVW